MAAQNATYRAAIEAGFTRTNFKKLKGIVFTTEPEAAGSYTVKALLEQGKITLEVMYFFNSGMDTMR